MLYQPKDLAMWDTWMYFENETHYLFTLHRSGNTGFDGISLATSEDGVHFSEQGIIISKREEAEWLGTGSTWKVGDKYYINFSEQVDGVQAIYIAESDDLLHWRRCEDVAPCRPDPRWYDDTKTGRWDCIWVLQKEDGSFVGYLTARPNSKGTSTRFTSVGKVVSKDGIHFEAAEPPEFLWDGSSQIDLYEVGAVEKVGNKVYMLVGLAEHLGSRQLWEAGYGGHGMYVFSADSLDGPFRLQKEHFRLLTSDIHTCMTYFSRFYPFGDEMLLCHHACENAPDKKQPEGVWFPPLKRAVPDEKDCLRLKYWSGNDCLAGEPLPFSLEEKPLFPADGISQANMSDDTLLMKETEQAALYMTKTSYKMEEGLVFRADIKVLEAGKNFGSFGIYLETDEEAKEGEAFLFSTKGLAEFGVLNRSGNFRPENVNPIVFKKGEKHSLIMLARHSLFEVYLDDYLVQCYSLKKYPTGRLGLICENASIALENIALKKMTL